METQDDNDIDNDFSTQVIGSGPASNNNSNGSKSNTNPVNSSPNDALLAPTQKISVPSESDANPDTATTENDSVSFDFHNRTINNSTIGSGGTNTSGGGLGALVGHGATPFLNKLYDPFAESPANLQQLQQHQAFQTPIMTRKKLFNMDKRSSSKKNAFDTMRLKQQEALVVEYETQSQGIMINDDDEEEDDDNDEQDSFKIADTQVVDNNIIETQRISVDDGATQVIDDNDNDRPYDVPSTQHSDGLENNIDRYQVQVPSTVEKIDSRERRDYEHTMFDEIVSQQQQQQQRKASKPQDEDSDLEMEMEIENTTVQYEPIEVDGADAGSNPYEFGFPEDSLKVYDQLRMKKKKRRRSGDDKDIDNDNETTELAKKLLMKDLEKTSSSPSTEIPNSSPSMKQQHQQVVILKEKNDHKHGDEDGHEDTAMSPISSDIEIVSSAASHKEIDVSSRRASSQYDSSGTSSPLTDLSASAAATATAAASAGAIQDDSDTVYRGPASGGKDTLTHADIVYNSSVWARIGDKFHPTVIQDVVEDGYVILHYGKPVHLQGLGNVFPLDIKVGDRIKIINKKKIHQVVGLSKANEEQQPKQQQSKIKCIRGYDTIYAIPLRASDDDGEQELIIPLEQCYLVGSLWNKRDFIRDVDATHFQADIASDISQRQIRGRGGKLLLELSPHKAIPQQQQQQHQIATKGLSAVNKNLAAAAVAAELADIPMTKSIWDNCVFTITSSTEQQRKDLTKLIVSNGGVVLEDGFSSIIEMNFTSSSSDVAATSRIIPEYRNFSFAACITSNGYCRSAKFLEALALGWPILSDQFLFDLAQRSEYTPYLIAAGECSLLNGHIKSQDVFKFRSNSIQAKPLFEQIGNNSHVLHDCKILKITTEQNNNSAKLKIASFLFVQLGAIMTSGTGTTPGVCLCKDIDSLKTELKKASSDRKKIKQIVFVNDINSDFTNHLKSELNHDDADNDDHVYVLDWEWLVQSIITGKFLDAV